MNRWLKAMAVAAGLGLSAGVMAGTVDITNTVDPLDPGKDKLNVGNASIFHPVTWSHDLTSELEGLTAVSGIIEIELWDDGDWRDEDARIVVGVIDFLDGAFSWDIDSGDFESILGANSIDILNDDGILHVALWTACDSLICVPGDFYIGDSILTVSAVHVPAPGTLALLGLGLAALGVVRKRTNA